MFTPHTVDSGSVLPWEYLPAAAGSYEAGQMLQTANGVLSVIGAPSATTPAYLCMGKATVEAGELIPVTRVSHDVIYQTTLGGDADGKGVGAKLQVGAGGLFASVDAEGTFEVTYLEDTAQGSVVRGRFL